MDEQHFGRSARRGVLAVGPAIARTPDCGCARCRTVGGAVVDGTEVPTGELHASSLSQQGRWVRRGRTVVLDLGTATAPSTNNESELASELLEVTDESQLENLVAALLRSVPAGLRINAPSTSDGATFMEIAKPVVKKVAARALPVIKGQASARATRAVPKPRGVQVAMARDFVQATKAGARSASTTATQMARAGKPVTPQTVQKLTLKGIYDAAKKTAPWMLPSQAGSPPPGGHGPSQGGGFPAPSPAGVPLPAPRPAPYRPRMGTPLEDQIDALIEIGFSSGHRDESIPWSLAQDIICSGNVGLLALFVGVAFWRITGAPISDPVGLSWGRTSAGKHLNDYRPGLGIAHFDGGTLRRIHADFGAPAGCLAASFPRKVADIRASSQGPAWDSWAVALLADRTNQRRLVQSWLDHFWNPSIAATASVEQAIANAGIRNSSPGQANDVAALSVADQFSRYGTTSHRRRRTQNLQRVIDLYGAAACS